MASIELEPMSTGAGPKELAYKELAYREADGLKVQLLYRKAGNEVLLHVFNTSAEQELEFTVPPEKALDAFEHPYVYAPEYFEAA
jgi:hypothetical protein